MITYMIIFLIYLLLGFANFIFVHYSSIKQNFAYYGDTDETWVPECSIKELFATLGLIIILWPAILILALGTIEKEFLTFYFKIPKDEKQREVLEEDGSN